MTPLGARHAERDSVATIEGDELSLIAFIHYD